MEIKVLNWNIGGAKFLEQKKRPQRDEVRRQLNEALAGLLRKYEPDVVTLQEVVRYKEPADHAVIDLIDDITGYTYYAFPLIDSLLFSSQAKWNKVKEGSDWHRHTYFAQGNAMMFKENAALFPVWDLSKIGEKSPGRQRLDFLSQFEPQSSRVTSDLELLTAQQRAVQDKKYLIEHVHLDSGLYFGDRNTEPRAALVAHLILDPLADTPDSTRCDRCRPLDVFIVNLHLTTIMKERVGIPNMDSEAVRIRGSQLNTVFDGIVSRYNSWADDGYPQRGKKRDEEDWETFERHKPVWILCGDFNFTEESDEYDFIKRRNFIDTTPEKGRRTQHGTGTKTSGAGNRPTLTLDYIFAGPKFIAFDPLFEQAGINRNLVDHDVRASDHYPVFSRLPLLLSSPC
ncbi:endonuclease/exonuclease/phosphatase family protein [Candidatus Sumerlaeota bacterium]|nr:endonuclease/exonuclease/phosphatase family protein [Candidatus Sumerlaeota bacterium]